MGCFGLEVYILGFGGIRGRSCGSRRGVWKSWPRLGIGRVFGDVEV